jgi:hypothetical protein
MSGISFVHDVGAYIVSNLLLQDRFATGDPENDGASLDTIPSNEQELGSALIQCDAAGTIAPAETATLAITLQDAADDGTGSPDTFADVAADVFMGAADGADGLPTNPVISLDNATQAGSFSFNVPLHRLRRHVRVQSLWTISGGADTVDYHCAAICGGTVVKPVS